MSFPTATEQYLLELINRGRADPLAEAGRYGIDLNADLASGTISTSNKAPLAFSAFLNISADKHSQSMIADNYFSHTGSDGSSASQRMFAAGWTSSNGGYATGENIAFAAGSGRGYNAATIEVHHAGLFKSSGHRENLMNDTFNEIGIGQFVGTYTSRGFTYVDSASMVTENFAAGGRTFLTGVVLNDADNDKFYDIGEGQGNITIKAMGTNGTFTTTTWEAGGYSLELAAGSYTVEFSGAGLNGTVTKSVDVGNKNVKLDAFTDEAINTANPVVQVGNENAESMAGDTGDDTFTGAGGNDNIDGGAGIDTSVYSGNLSDYSVTKSSSNYLIFDNRSGSPEGTDTLVNVEKLQFADQTVDIDAGVTFTSSVETLFSSYGDAAKGLSAAYGVLLDGVPNQTGFKFLIGNAAVTNFGAGDGPVFNQENIFINLVNNLVQGNPAAKAKFNTLATGDTLEAKITALYKAVIPVSNQTTDGLNFFTRPEGIKFFEDAAAERGIAGAEGAAVAALAAMLKIVVTEDIGIGNSVNDLIKAIAAGSSGVPETSSDLIPLETADGTAFDGDEASTSRLSYDAPAADDEVPLIQTVGTVDDLFAMV